MQNIPITDVQTMFQKAKADGDVKHYKKFQYIDARPAKQGEVVRTVVKGKPETINSATDGDYVARARSESQEQYIINSKVFIKRYSATGNTSSDGWSEYAPIGEIYAFAYSGDSFTFIAPWGEPVIVNNGDYIGSPDTNDLKDIYRVEKQTFLETYKEI